MKIDADSAQVKVPPPLLEVVGILAGLGFQWVAPEDIISVEQNSLRLALMTICFAASIGGILYCFLLFKKYKTEVAPWKTSSKLIRKGPYKFSRNPIYLFFIIFGLGVALSLNSLWIGVMQIPVVVALRWLVIEKEEQYLEKKFGEKYLAYKDQVGRWF
ncbi:MAG: isoprenylcysteine carboxylmethyltransferase family protein [Bdellovibrionales bacterium]